MSKLGGTIYLIPEVDGDSVVATLHGALDVVPPEYWDEEEVSRPHHRLLTSRLCKLGEPRQIWTVKIDLQEQDKILKIFILQQEKV